MTEQNIYPVSVDYSMSLGQMIALGKYDWTNSEVSSKHFPVNRRGTAKADIVLVQFDHAMKSEDVLRELDAQGLRPAELPELLAFGATYPEKQGEFPVVALGSVWQRWDGYRGIAGLCGGAGERYLDLCAVSTAGGARAAGSPPSASSFIPLVLNHSTLFDPLNFCSCPLRNFWGDFFVL